jgi:hypothetical protein
MADIRTTAASGDGVAFLVSAGLVYEIIAAACSSPQTTEINAQARSGTLMKWVYIGIAQATVFVAAASIIEPKHRTAILAGGITGGALMLASYIHANRAGIANGGPGTEHYA